MYSTEQSSIFVRSWVRARSMGKVISTLSFPPHSSFASFLRWYIYRRWKIPFHIFFFLLYSNSNVLLLYCMLEQQLEEEKRGKVNFCCLPREFWLLPLSVGAQKRGIMTFRFGMWWRSTLWLLDNFWIFFFDSLESRIYHTLSRKWKLHNLTSTFICIFRMIFKILFTLITWERYPKEDGRGKRSDGSS